MLADRVLHTSTTTGTGTYDLVDPATGEYLSAVASVGSGSRLVYLAKMGASWEICWGVVTAGSPATLTRNLIRSSTGALINWGAGTKTISSIAQADLARFGGRGSLPTSGGTANAQTITHVTPMRAQITGMEVVFIAGNTNTGATTLNVDGLGAATLLAPGAAACVGGELRSGMVARAIYDGTNWRLSAFPAGPIPTNAAGIGQRTRLTPGDNAALVLPAGGTWDYIAIGYATVGGTLIGGMFTSGVAAGGTTVGAAGGAGNSYLAFVLRVG